MFGIGKQCLTSNLSGAFLSAVQTVMLGALLVQVYKATIDGVTQVAVKMFHDVHNNMQQADILREVAILKSCRCLPSLYPPSLLPPALCSRSNHRCPSVVTPKIIPSRSLQILAGGHANCPALCSLNWTEMHVPCLSQSAPDGDAHDGFPQ